MAESAPKEIEAVREAADQMTVCLARQLRDGERVFLGVNSLLPMTAIHLARRLHAPRAVLIGVAGGVDARPRFLPLSSCHPELCHGAAALFSMADAYDLFARGGIDLLFLGAAQIDRAGRVNLSWIGDPAAPKMRLPGGGGGAVIMPQAGRTVIWRTVHDRRTFVPEVDFCTQSGNLSRVITPLAVLGGGGGSGLSLESVHPGRTAEEVAARTGFALDLSGEVPQTPPPSPEERAALEEIDPGGVRFTEFK
ncbi:MAG: CoA-transferase [bacterium]